MSTSTWRRPTKVELGERVLVVPIRDAFYRSGRTLSEVANELGWTKQVRGYISADTSRLARKLAIMSFHGGTLDDDSASRRTLRYADAVSIVRAMDADPVDCGV